MLQKLEHKGVHVCLTILSALVFGACQGTSEAPQASEVVPSPTRSEEGGREAFTPTPAALPEISPRATQADEAERPFMSEGSLNESGPWFVFKASDGIWAVNPDGSAITQLADQDLLKHYGPFLQVAPSGGRVAYLTGREMYFNLKLNMLTLPGGSTQVVTNLTSEDTEPGPEAAPGDEIFEALRAIVEVPSMSWSPDGRMLAFMGVMQGESSDLYVYLVEDGSLLRLTDGPSEGIRPTWTPDGEAIVHFGVRTMGTGAGASLTGAWAASVDDTSVQTLYEPGLSGDEIVVGWADEDTFVVHSWTAGCGPSNVRTYNLRSSEMRVLWEDGFDRISFDPESGMVFIATARDSGACNPEGAYGLYMVPAAGGEGFRIVDEEIRAMEWEQAAGLLLVRSEFGGLAVSSNGEFIDLDTPAESFGVPTADGETRTLAWIGEGLWIGPLLGSIENPPRKIFEARTHRAYWVPEGEALLFFAEDGLYAAEAPDLSPVRVAGVVGERPWQGYWVHR